MKTAILSNGNLDLHNDIQNDLELINIKIYNSITEISEIQWDKIVSIDGVVCTHRFLEAVEKSNINDCKFFYPIVYKNNEVIAHACIYSISMQLDIFAKGIIKKIINLIRKFWKNFLIIKVLECGTPIAIGNTISLSENIESNYLLKLILSSIEEIAKREKLKIIFIRDFYANDRTIFDHILKYEYHISYNLPCAILDISWNTFGNYLKSMRKDYRRNIIANQRKFDNSGIEIQVLKNFSIYSAELVQLWRNLYDNAKEYRREILTQNFFKNMEQYLENETEVLIFKKDGLIIAFMLLIYNNDTLIPLYAGLNYQDNKEYSIYFNLLYKVIEIGINKKMKHINFAITTLETKKRMGAEIITLYMYMRHLNPVLNIFINKIFEMFIPDTKLLSRRVFK